jgi:hypothetical protein
MEHAEGDRTTDEREIPNSDDDGDVFLASGSLKPRRSAIVSGMLSISIRRTVTFSDTVTMYIRRLTGHLVSIAMLVKDRGCNTQLIGIDLNDDIKQTEKALGDIFSDTHRDNVK